MRTIKHIFLLMAVALAFVACEDKEWSEDYDIKWPAPVITGISPSSAQIGEIITISGSNFDKVSQITIGILNCEIIEEGKTDSKIQVVVPRRATMGQVSVRNLYKRIVTSESYFTPTYPDVKVTSWPNAIVAGENFAIEGENVDLITTVNINGTDVTIRASSETSRISVPTVGLKLVPGTTATIRVTALGAIDGNSEISGIAIEEPTDIFDAVAPIILWDFEDGEPTVENAGKMPDQYGRNLGGLIAPRGENYYSVIVNQTGGWSNFMFIVKEGSFDLGEFHEPHLTMLVNTNGKRGYVNPFFTQDGETKDNHLTNGNANERKLYNDNYLVETDGWEWRSYPISKLFPDFNDKGVFEKIMMRFTSGNVGNDGADEPFEIHVDQIMITDGLQLPATKIFDFETTVPEWEDNGAAATGSVKTESPRGAFSKYYGTSFTSPEQWKWVGAIGSYNPIELSGIVDPHISLLINTNGNSAFFQIETTQNDVKWGGSIPNVYEVSTTGWETVTIRLSELFTGNWGGTGTASAFDPTQPMDYLKIGFTTGNVDSGMKYELNIDDVYISDGAMW
jgi:hypothetical protein